MVPKGYWHGYISAHEPALARAVATAYPTQRLVFAVTRWGISVIESGEFQRSSTQGAEATRRYVAKRLDVHIRAVQARLEQHDQTNPPPAT